MKHTISHDVETTLARKAAHKAFEAYQAKFAEYNPSVVWQDEDHATIGFKVKGVALNGTVALRPQAVDLVLDVPFVLKIFQKRAVGIIETKEAIAAVLAADAAAKAASVHLIEVKTVVGGGKGYLSLCGEVGDVRTAIAAGINAIKKELIVSHVVIPQADPQLLATVGK